jgi:protein farnesyltransferase/geranylgeranyltransferase type-1 subunit alpha
VFTFSPPLHLCTPHADPVPHIAIRQHRYKTLIALHAPLDVELRLMDELAIKYLKTYQVWHHRRLLLTALRASASSSSSPSSPSSSSSEALALAHAELAFIARCLAEDAKNYHTWSYRQWLLAHFDAPTLWAAERAWVARALADDVRNNSAWHHRFFVVFQAGPARTRDKVGGEGEGEEEEEEEGEEEVYARETRCVAPSVSLPLSDTPPRPPRYAKQAIALAPNNASAWNYLRGVLDRAQTPYAAHAAFAELYARASSPLGDEDEDDGAGGAGAGVLDLDNPGPGVGAALPAPAALEFLADALEQAGGAADLERAVLVSTLSVVVIIKR